MSLTLTCLKYLSQFLLLLPNHVRLFFGDVIGFLFWDVFSVRNEVVLKNLEIAFPHYSNKLRNQIGRDSVFSLGRSLVETLYLPAIDEKWVKTHVDFEGLSNYRQAKGQGRGVLFLSLHMGCGDLAIASLSLSGFPLHSISKSFKSEWANGIWYGLREPSGTHFIEAHGEKTAFDILKALKKNEDVIFVLDQYMGPPYGVPTTFFGKETGTAYGLSLFALKTKAPVLPIFTYRNGDGKTIIRIESEIPFEKQDDKDSTLKYMTQKYNNELERLIKLKPDQWMWVHRRWKPFLSEPKE